MYSNINSSTALKCIRISTHLQHSNVFEYTSNYKRLNLSNYIIAIHLIIFNETEHLMRQHPYSVYDPPATANIKETFLQNRILKRKLQNF